jgi:serine/threonine-protein kinase RsbW
MTISQRIQSLEVEENVHVSRRSLLLKMELRSNPETLCVVRGAVTQLTERLGFPESECRAVVLGVDEALTNIIRHAYAGRAERPIEVSFCRIRAPWRGANREALEIVLVDRGKKVDRAKLCGRALEDVRPGGLGLHFIRESMDAVEFRRANGRNQLRLVKFLRVPGPRRGS